MILIMKNNYSKKKDKESPNFKNRVGEKFITNEGYEVEIIEYFDCNNVTLKLKDNNVLTNIRFSAIKKGQVKNPYHKSVYGVGCIGVGLYSTTNNVLHYNCWRSLLQRCYDKNYQQKYPTYKDCAVDTLWHNFQNFAQWFEENYVEGWNLDKDILIKGNKIYSFNTCAFVPHEINQLFVKSNKIRGIYPIGVIINKEEKFVAKIKNRGIVRHLGTFDTIERAFQTYKTEKEKYIKEVADKWKDLIDPRVYEAMYNYKVEITD